MNLFNNFDMVEAVEQISRQGAVTIPNFLVESVRLQLLTELVGMPMEVQSATFGYHNTRQNFSSVSDFPSGTTFVPIKDELEKFLNAKFSAIGGGVISQPLKFSDVVVQTYPPNEIGISPHRDGKSCINLVVIVVLEGNGEFCLCDDRGGKNPVSIRNEPGDLLLMRGPGFLGGDVQPFHFVRNIRTKRTTFGLRHRVKK